MKRKSKLILYGYCSQNIKYRNVITIDIFLTTLAVLGVEIEGE